QKGESFNLLKRIAGLRENQAKGIMQAPKIEMDAKDFGIGAQILHDLNISKMRLMTNTQQTKRVGIIGYGLEIVDYVSY
ncbi:MAG: bifunctional 3,4-dihydroxy-2-butanone-4-phosphate synthase/GTP cyclohydrolase II, partial [Eudoraea sp.]|nr:bifunctional 3,4-dihydroxy-2-butanone-4-phosphate synthase/GTP cyclohydrolase II [Eudoraea sp.]